MTHEVIHGDCLDVLPTLASGSVDAVVCDPPYALTEPRSALAGGWKNGCKGQPRSDEDKAARRGGFMGKAWDSSLPGAPHWQAALHVLKPGGYLLAFGGTRTYHRLACAVEDAGFEIRDCLMWVYGSGFPKGKGCLKPAWEPILLARRPGPKVLPLGIDACRVGTSGGTQAVNFNRRWGGVNEGGGSRNEIADLNTGRWPANLCHDGSDEVLEAFAAFGESKSVASMRGERHGAVYGNGKGPVGPDTLRGHADTGTAARFYYCAKASKADRDEGNGHPTVKPTALMRWLCRLVTPPGGMVLDPFAGSGSTGKAAALEGFRFIGIEREAAYVEIARRRIAAAQSELPLFPEGASC